MPSHVEENFEAFQKILPTIPVDKYGKFALMQDRTIIEFFDSAGDAKKAGNLALKGKKFSIQEVTALPIDLGWYSHAIPC